MSHKVSLWNEKTVNEDEDEAEYYGDSFAVQSYMVQGGPSKKNAAFNGKKAGPQPDRPQSVVVSAMQSLILDFYSASGHSATLDPKKQQSKKQRFTWGLLPIDEFLLSMLVSAFGAMAGRDVSLSVQLSSLLSLPEHLCRLLPNIRLQWSTVHQRLWYNVKTDAGCLRPCIGPAAAGWNDIAMASLFKKGPQPTPASLENMCAAAAMFGNVQLLNLLKYEDSATCYSGSSSLTASCSVGDLTTTQWILQHEKDPRHALLRQYTGMVPCADGWAAPPSALHAATRGGSLALMRTVLLVECERRGANGKPPSDLALWVAEFGSVAMLRCMLEEARYTGNERNAEGMTPLMTAAALGEVEKCFTILKYGSDVNLELKDSTVDLTALQWAKMGGEPCSGVVQLLMRHGAQDLPLPEEGTSS